MKKWIYTIICFIALAAISLTVFAETIDNGIVDQSVKATDSPTFVDLTLTGSAGVGGGLDIEGDAEVGGDFTAGSFQMEGSNPGITAFLDCNITAGSADGTEHGYTLDVDTTTVLQVTMESDGAGSVDTPVITATASINISGGFTRNVTLVNASTYDLLSTDDILHVYYTATAAVTSLTLPTAQVINGRAIVIKDAGGNASSNNITIDTEGSETIDGSATLTVNGDYNASSLYCDGNNWMIY